MPIWPSTPASCTLSCFLAPMPDFCLHHMLLIPFFSFALLLSFCAYLQSLVSFLLALRRANLRAAVKPDWINKVEIPYTNALKHGKIVQGEVVAVTKDTVQLADGRTFPYDYVIVGASCCHRS